MVFKFSQAHLDSLLDNGLISAEHAKALGHKETIGDTVDKLAASPTPDPITQGGDPHDPLNGEIPREPAPEYTGPVFNEPKRKGEDEELGTGLHGFQRGYTSADGTPPVPENETAKTPPPAPAAPPPAPLTAEDKFQADMAKKKAENEAKGIRDVPLDQGPGAAVSQFWQNLTGGTGKAARLVSSDGTAAGAANDLVGFAISPTSGKPASELLGAGKTVPPVDTKGAGEGGTVIDKQPADDPSTQAYMAGIAERQAQAAGVKSYNDTLTKWKGAVNDNYDGYVGSQEKDLAQFQTRKGQIIERQANDAASQQEMAGAIQFQTKQRDDQIQAEGHKALNAKLDDIDKMQNEMLNTKIDPTRWFSNQNAVGAIFRTIGLVLLSGPAHTDLMSETIDRDVASQMRDYNIKKDGVAEKKNLYGQYVDLLKNKDAAATATRMSLTTYATSQLEAMAMRHGGELGRQNADIAAQQLKVQTGEQQFKLWGQLNPAPAAPGGGGGGMKLPAYDPKTTVTLPGGLSYVAPDEKTAGETREAVAAYQEVISSTGEMKALSKDKLTFVPGTKENYQFTALRTRLKLATDSKYIAVARSPEGRELLDAATAVPSAWTPETAAKLDKVVERAGKGLEATVRSHNGTVVRDAFDRDPSTGLPVRRALPTGQTTQNWTLKGPSSATPPSKSIPGAKSNE